MVTQQKTILIFDVVSEVNVSPLVDFDLLVEFVVSVGQCHDVGLLLTILIVQIGQLLLKGSVGVAEGGNLTLQLDDNSVEVLNLPQSVVIPALESLQLCKKLFVLVAEV